MKSPTFMQCGNLVLLSAFVVGAAAPAVARNHARRGPAKLLIHRAVKPRIVGPRAIADPRATEIQAALIKSGYLTGPPSGHWDETTEAAMTKLQAENGWQTKLVPDSRAIIKLGLGPTADSLANETAPSSAGQTSTMDPH